MTDSISVLIGPNNGQYPSGNSLVVEGTGETVIIDPSVTVVANGGAPLPVDAVINSHSHEDHLAGNGLFAESRIRVHHDDLVGVQSLDGLMAVYGLDGAPRESFEQTVLEEFNFTPRPDAEGFSDGHLFDLGGGVTVEAVHLPGHTRGHSGFRMDGVFFLSDIDLTGFGPYYGDVWSDLEQFEASLAKVRDEEADVLRHLPPQGHHREPRHVRRDARRVHGRLGRRHEAMLDFLAEPRSIDDMRAHRFIYRRTSSTHSPTLSRRAAHRCTSIECSPEARQPRSSRVVSSGSDPADVRRRSRCDQSVDRSASLSTPSSAPRRM